MLSLLLLRLASVTDARDARSVVNQSVKTIYEGVNKTWIGLEVLMRPGPIMSENKRENVSDAEHILHNRLYSSH